MSGITYDYMENYIRGLIGESTNQLKELEDFAHKFNVPIVQKEVAKFLEVMLTLKRPQKILELGTAIGYSAILMNLTLKGNCSITTVERNEDMIKIAEENIKKYNMEKNIKIINGDCLQVLENLDEEFDFIFMDAGKGHYGEFHNHCLRLLSSDGVIVADNVLFRGMIANSELVQRRKITIVKRMRKYLDKISKDDKLLTTVIPMGDGVAVTTRRNSNE